MSGQISTQDITPFEITTGEAEMTDAPEKIWAWTSPRDEEPNRFWTTGVVNSPTKAHYTRTDLAEADRHKAYLTGVRDGECAAYLRGLEDAGAAIRNACNCDSALDAIRALAKEKRK